MEGGERDRRKTAQFFYANNYVTHSAFVLDAVLPKVASREFLPNYQGRPREQHLSCAQYSTAGVIEGEGAVDDVI